MTRAEFTGENGPLVWGFRALLIFLAALLTLIAGISLAAMQDIEGALSGVRSEITGIRAEIATVRLEVAQVRERMAENYITRTEAVRMIEESERRTNARIDRELSRRFGPPAPP